MSYNYNHEVYSSYYGCWPKSHLTNFRKKEEDIYTLAIKESNFENILEIKNDAHDCNGHNMAGYLSLHFKEGAERQDLSKFWRVF